MKIFIIHGWTYTLDKWQELCDILQQNGIEVVQLRVPGLTAESHDVWDIRGYENWLQQQLAGETKPVVIGHSNGGRIALNYLSHNPGAFGKLILIDSAGIYHGDILSKLKRGTFKAAAKIGKPLAHVPVARKVFYKLIGAKDYAKAPDNMKKTMRYMLAADKQLDFSKIQNQPIQLIWGKKDTSTPLSDAHKLQQLLHAPLEVIAGAGHSPHASHPTQVADLILASIKGSQS